MKNIVKSKPSLFSSAFLFLVMAVIMAVGCAGDGLTGTYSGQSGDRTMSFMVESRQSAASIGVPLKAFVIKLYKNNAQFAADKPFFVSDCSPFSKGFTIGHISEGDDYVVKYQGYVDSACLDSSLGAVGVRGGVRVTSLGTGDGYYYLQINAVGKLTSLPLPDNFLNPVSGGVVCNTDSDCRRVIPCPDPASCTFPVTVDCDSVEIEAGECPDGTKIMQYNVHPMALCDSGICRLKTLFPLNTRGDRAFATATCDGNGDLVTVGGFSAVESGRLVVAGYNPDAACPETFMLSADTGIFEVLEHNRPLDAGLGMSGCDMLDDTRLVVAGGTAIAGVGQPDAIPGTPYIHTEDCATDCPVDMSAIMYVIDTESGSVSRATLDQEMVPSAVVAVHRDRPGFYIRGGAAISTTGGFKVSGATANSWICNVSDSNGVSCDMVSGGVTRFLPSGACIERREGLCSRYLTVGGTSDATRFAEIYNAADNSIKILTGSGDVPYMLSGASVFMAGDRIWAVGGTSDRLMAEPAVPYSLNIDEDARTVIVSRVNMKTADIESLTRAFQQVTVLADGSSVLVTGGVDGQGNIRDDAVLLKVNGNELEVVESTIPMAAARMGHTATLVEGGLYDQAVLVTGGIDATGFVSGAEIYLPR